ncbi:uncharacterized protein L969DRAFT_93568 [Mixia osmundae IAM 14324]|nr:uncharacterized protein L969DRAFT_93568 [Mixia osmundae IAM 14324]KEI41059.1 hypothetical protein L969DRAFT_93568 [Mixia osmundae IAM 14324]
MVEASFADAQARPLDVIQALAKQHLYSDTSTDAFELRVTNRFKELLADKFDQIPSLDQTDALEQHSLVRFRCMLQDTGLGSEVYAATTRDNAGNEHYRLWCDEAPSDSSTDLRPQDDASALRERQLIYAVEIPGEAAWLRPAQDVLSNAANLTPDDSKSRDLLSGKFPLPGTSHKAALLKLYVPDDSLKAADTVEVIGILDRTSFSPGSLDDPGAPLDETATGPTIPSLHIVAYQAVDRTSIRNALPSLSQRSAVRDALVAYIAKALDGDLIAAEWTLLHLISKTHTRRGALALGSLPLNLTLPSSKLGESEKLLHETLAYLLPTFVELPMTIDALNATTPYSPVSKDENLQAGRLQLAPGTQVLIDERALHEGKLNEAGLKNVQAVTRAISDQKLSYIFPFSSFDLDIDLNFLVLSIGKSFLQISCNVPVQPQGGSSGASNPTSPDLAAFRAIIAEARAQSFTIPDAVSKHIQDEFVEQRRSAPSGVITQEDLQLRLTLAR